LIHALLGICVPFAVIPTHATKHELVHCIRLSKVTRVFVFPSRLATMIEAAREVGFPIDHIHIMGQDAGSSAEGMVSLEELMQNARNQKISIPPAIPAKKDTMAYLVFSSGTTGLPKAVIITQGNIAFIIKQSTTAMGFVAKHGQVSSFRI
jgi:long-subunit acyl-CoA synthetase (AMP-forming)